MAGGLVHVFVHLLFPVIETKHKGGKNTAHIGNHSVAEIGDHSRAVDKKWGAVPIFI